MSEAQEEWTVKHLHEDIWAICRHGPKWSVQGEHVARGIVAALREKEKEIEELRSRAENAEDVLQNNTLTFAEIRGFIHTWDWATPESYAQRTPREKQLYDLWVFLKQKIETVQIPDKKEIERLREQDAFLGEILQQDEEQGFRRDLEISSLSAQLTVAGEALEWYRDEAAAIAKHSEVGDAGVDAQLASMTVLGLDGGKRAASALSSIGEQKYEKTNQEKTPA